MLDLLILKTLNSLTVVQGRNHKSKLRVRNQAEPESRMQSTQDLRAGLESSPKPEKEQRRGLGRGSVSPSQKIF